MAPSGNSISVQEGRLKLEPLETTVTPRDTIDRLFESAVKAYGDKVIGVILSGFLADGSRGLREVDEAGGLTVIQNPQQRPSIQTCPRTRWRRCLRRPFASMPQILGPRLIC